MHELVATPYRDRHLVLRPGSPKAVQLSAARFAELQAAAADDQQVPVWLRNAARQQWSINLSGTSAAAAVLLREAGPYEFSRATYEINLGCDFDCEMCYLGEKRFEGLDLTGKRQLLHVMRDAGVIWLQITGGCRRELRVPRRSRLFGGGRNRQPVPLFAGCSVSL
ncbi:hypothetical protein AB0D14_38415 [Streptomyces sp. NPDC048484]|uniref:hypothetical protein n=1 Tax=Streptomyces sp. NPDC048484 TaxID=3155146 RepID=UPI003435999C